VRIGGNFASWTAELLLMADPAIDGLVSRGSFAVAPCSQQRALKAATVAHLVNEKTVAH